MGPVGYTGCVGPRSGWRRSVGRLVGAVGRITKLVPRRCHTAGAGLFRLGDQGGLGGGAVSRSESTTRMTSTRSEPFELFAKFLGTSAVLVGRSRFGCRPYGDSGGDGTIGRSRIIASSQASQRQPSTPGRFPMGGARITRAIAAAHLGQRGGDSTVLLLPMSITTDQIGTTPAAVCGYRCRGGRRVRTIGKAPGPGTIVPKQPLLRCGAVPRSVSKLPARRRPSDHVFQPARRCTCCQVPCMEPALSVRRFYLRGHTRCKRQCRRRSRTIWQAPINSNGSSTPRTGPR